MADAVVNDSDPHTSTHTYVWRRAKCLLSIQFIVPNLGQERGVWLAAGNCPTKVCERERQKERERGKVGERERGRERVAETENKRERERTSQRCVTEGQSQTS